MKRTKVLQVLASGAVGGGTTHLRMLATGLDPAEFEIVVACSDDGPLLAELKEAGVRCAPVAMPRAINPAASLALHRLMKLEGVDVAHMHGTRAALAALPSAVAAGVERIYTVHGWSFHDRGSPLMEGVARRIEQSLVSGCPRVICVGQSDRLKGEAWGILRPEQASVIYNGVDATRFERDPEVRARTRASLGIPSEAPVVALFGRMTYQKGQRLLLEAAGMLRSLHSELRYLLVGDGEDREGLEHLARAWGLADRVIFTGFRDDIPELLAASDIVTLPSWWEGLPIALLEAMAARRPVIATRVDGSSEVVAHGQTGLLIDPGRSALLAEAIASLLSDPARAREMGEQGYRRVVSMFSEREMIRATADCYREAIAPALRRARA